MGNYLEAYRKRMENNNDKLLKLGKDLKKLGYSVKIWPKRLISSITIYDQNNKGVRVQFNETPYRFSFEYDTEPSRETGSGFTGKEFYVNGFDLPFTTKEIIEAFKPMYKDERFENYTVEIEENKQS